MAITRSKKIKFDEDEHIEAAPVVQAPPQPQEEEDEEASDSDEAPEEESISASKKNLIEQKKAQEKLQNELKKAEKEKRKAQDERNRQQQEEKRRKEEENASVPELLPDELVSAVVETKPAPKHIKVQELDAISARMLRQKQREEQLRKIKASKGKAVNKGAIYVQVQSFNKKKMAPRAESVVDMKNSWLQRSSLGKR